MSLSWDAATSAPRFEAYAWDQSERFVSVYVDLKPNDDDREHEVTSLFEERRFAVVVNGQAILCPNLCKSVIATKCKVKVKANRFVVKLRKQTEAEMWSDLTDSLDVKEAARKRRVATTLKDASTQELLADMYANASDEDRRGLLEAAAAGQKKRDEQSRSK